MKKNKVKLLSLDLDGVLHNADDVIMLNFPKSAQPWQIAIGLKAQKRFAWAEHLVQALDGHSDVAIIIHSTWRKRYSDEMMKQFLPHELAERIIVLDGQIEGRADLSSDAYVRRALDLISPDTVCVLDDRPEFFLTGETRAWIDGNDGRFVWCEPSVGVQSSSVVEEIGSWVRDANQHSPQQVRPKA